MARAKVGVGIAIASYGECKKEGGNGQGKDGGVVKRRKFSYSNSKITLLSPAPQASSCSCLSAYCCSRAALCASRCA